MSTFNITTLGCPKNIVDSQHLKRLFTSEGFVHADNLEDADILLINTCGFIKEAKEESIEEILALTKLKADSKKLIVFGCLSKRYIGELTKEIPEIDGIWGVGEEDKIIDYCKSLVISRQSTGEIKVPVAYCLSPVASSSYAYIKIAEGCDKRCTFCVIPSIRGKFRSISPEYIVKEAEEQIRMGARELILVAQDITNYGKELSGYNLLYLLKDLVSLTGDFHVRLLYLYPTGIDDNLLEFIATSEKMYKYLDVPLQHSEDRILRLMGRRGSQKEYRKLIRHIRRSIPEVALRTTCIVGFPTETEEEFNGLVDFIEESGFDRLGVFKYSREEGTPAAKLKGQVPEHVKIRRFDEIMKRQSFISLEKNRELIGRRFEAIIDEIDGDVAIARLYSHAPEIDGVVIIEKDYESRIMGHEEPYPLHLPSSLKVGDSVTVEIVDAFDYDVKGKLLS